MPLGAVDDLVGSPPASLEGAPEVDKTGLKLDLNGGGRAGCFEAPICDVADEFLRLGSCLGFNLVSVSDFLFLLASSSLCQISISIRIMRGGRLGKP
jgi:hypothetical protein